MALDRPELAVDRVEVGLQRVGQRGEPGRELGISTLLRQLLRPVEGEVEVTAPVVDLADPATGRLVLVEQPAGRPVQTLGERRGTGVRDRCGERDAPADDQQERVAGLADAAQAPRWRAVSGVATSSSARVKRPDGRMTRSAFAGSGR